MGSRILVLIMRCLLSRSKKRKRSRSKTRRVKKSMFMKRNSRRRSIKKRIPRRSRWI